MLHTQAIPVASAAARGLRCTTSTADSFPLRDSCATAARQLTLTSRQHHHDGENHLVVCVRRDIAEAHRYEPGEHEIERGRVATLQASPRRLNSGLPDNFKGPEPLQKLAGTAFELFLHKLKNLC